jgi:hypothetical protein
MLKNTKTNKQTQVKQLISIIIFKYLNAIITDLSNMIMDVLSQLIL